MYLIRTFCHYFRRSGFRSLGWPSSRNRPIHFSAKHEYRSRPLVFRFLSLTWSKIWKWIREFDFIFYLFNHLGVSSSSTCWRRFSWYPEWSSSRKVLCLFLVFILGSKTTKQKLIIKLLCTMKNTIPRGKKS